MKLSAALDGFWIAMIADGRSGNTIEIYKWAMRIFVSKVGDVELDSITNDVMRQFWGWIRNDYVPTRANKNDKSPLSGQSLNNVYTALRSFWGWANREEHTTKRPDLKIARPQFTAREVGVVQNDDIRKVLAACERSDPAETHGRASYTSKRSTADRDKAIILLLLDTGIRVSEMCRLNVGDVDIKVGEINIAPHGGGRKTKARLVYISDTTRKALWKYMAKSRSGEPKESPLFVTRWLKDRASKPVTRSSVRHLLVDLGKRAGISSGNFHPHRLRHTAATALSVRSGGIESGALMKLFGWSSPAMAKTYVDISKGHLRDIHRRSSPVDGLDLREKRN